MALFGRGATVMHVKLSNSHGNFGDGCRLVRLQVIEAPLEFLEFHSWVLRNKRLFYEY